MNKKTAVRLAAVGVVVLAAFGCARNDVVKKEEPMAPVAEKAKTAAVNPATAKASTVASPQKSQTMKPLEGTAAKAAAIATTFESIYFNFDKSDLSQAARNILAQNAATIKTEPGVKVRIEGNCDERGSAEYNLALGERRAKSALQYLITLGVLAERLTFISFGKEHPAVSGDNESAWAKNRRDDFVIQK